MINAKDFLAALEVTDIRFITGVPDSLLRDVSAEAMATYAANRHVIATNEGAAIGLAVGHYLATGRPALVYLQNSGLGNAVNPLVSLADPAIYGVPMILLLGWRGELRADGGQLADEPQHVVQGQITLQQLALMGIPSLILDGETDIRTSVAAAANQAAAGSHPVALVARRHTFPDGRPRTDSDTTLPSREQSIAAVIAALPGDIPVVATTGMASRELFELRAAAEAGHHRDFLTVGGMGHAISIATGIALARPERKVLCLDGDGAMLMHLGALTTSGAQPNIMHVILNNAAHDSVGGQPTAAARLDLTDIARSCGYTLALMADHVDRIASAMARLLEQTGSSLLDIRCRKGARTGLGRPTRTPAENKRDFIAFLAEMSP
jgi:phosphonopyruvate decarboxylase